MVIWKQRICDICGKETNYFEKSLIIKRRWSSRMESGWHHLDICKDCAERMMEFIEKETTN